MPRIRAVDFSNVVILNPLSDRERAAPSTPLIPHGPVGAADGGNCERQVAGGRRQADVMPIADCPLPIAKIPAAGADRVRCEQGGPHPLNLTNAHQTATREPRPFHALAQTAPEARTSRDMRASGDSADAGGHPKRNAESDLVPIGIGYCIGMVMTACGAMFMTGPGFDVAIWQGAAFGAGIILAIGGVIAAAHTLAR